MTDDIKNRWADYRRRRRAFLVALAAYVPLTVLVLIFLERLATGFFIAFGLLVIIPLGLRHIFFACPNCGESIHFKSFANFLGRTCSHCGVKIGAIQGQPKA
jgi:hypothetical protein